MRKEDLKKKIIEMLNRSELHGYEAHKQMASIGFKLHISYLYRVLAEMEKEGYLESNPMKSTLGPERKVYRLGEKGWEELDQTLREAVRTIHVRYMDYLAKLSPQNSILRRLQRLLDVHMAKSEKILVVAPKVFYDWMIAPLCNRLKKGTVYLIKPKSTKLDVEFENLVVLDTPPGNILLKDNFVDAVRVHGEPEDFHEAVKEFHRILKKDGSLALIIPYFHSYKDNYPLTFAEFVEKVEHEISEEDKNKLDYETTKLLLSHLFRKVKYYRLTHLAIFVTKGKIEECDSIT